MSAGAQEVGDEAGRRVSGVPRGSGPGTPTWTKIQDFDSTTGFNECALRYEPVADRYEFLLNGGGIYTLARSQG